MKKVLIIESSPRKGFSQKISSQIKNILMNSVETETITLRDYEILRCKGCCACLSKGSTFCPLKTDDTKSIFEKMLAADGIIYIIPNYSLQVPGIMKDFLDRLSFVFHRPRMFGKVCLPVVVQGVYGGNKIAKYINEVMGFWGMITVKGLVVSGGIYPAKEKDEKISQKETSRITRSIQIFLNELNDQRPRKPSFFKLMIFRMTRSSINYFEEALPPDREYYLQRGWFSSPYYYKVHLNPLKKIIGFFFDNMIKSMAKPKKNKRI